MKSPEGVKQFVQGEALAHGEKGFGTRGMKGAMIGLIDRRIGKDARHQVFGFLFGKESSKEFTDAEWYALYKWMDMIYVDGVYLPQKDFAVELDTIVKIKTGARVKRKEYVSRYMFD